MKKKGEKEKKNEREGGAEGGEIKLEPTIYFDKVKI